MADPRDLMQRYQDGDAGAFRELYALVSPRLPGYLLKMARSRAVAEDLLQQTFLKVHRARVLTAEDPAQTRRLLADAFDAFAWRAAA